ncbi:MAG: RNA polymerase sigma factor RpoH [Gammaproteobacteria bacterium AqS3]|nr:RNA polymerase sigma factor RpoH [Gammaproteobacteria bacterium AqS3]
MSSLALTNNAYLPSAPGDSLQAYLDRIHEIEILTPEQERGLAEDYRQHNDLEAARRLVMAHLRFVVMVSRNYQGYGLPLIDLIQEGNIGLMKAVKRFDPDRGVRLMTFAVHWIRAEIHEFILRNWRIVKIGTTKAQRKLFFNLRSMKKRLARLTGEEAREIAEDLDVPVGEVLKMDHRMSAHDVSIDVEPDDESENATPAFQLASSVPTPEEELIASEGDGGRLEQMRSALKNLDERSRDILMRRRMSETKTSLQELAAEYGISAERVRQIESRAIDRLRSELAPAALQQ